jgi:filamentous hemagglutinin
VSEETSDPPRSQFLQQPVEISERKAGDYLLDVNHRDGGAKARFFLAKGFSASDWRAFAEAIARLPVDNPIQEVEATEFGVKVMVLCRLRTPDGTDPCILTVWMVEGAGAPRLVTAYPSRA